MFKKDSASNVFFIKKPVKKKNKTIYLTFDDGPDRTTKIVYNILKEEEIPATMFLIGEHVYDSRMQQNMFDSLKACNYFELANFSYSHALKNRFNTFYSLQDNLVQDFTRSADSLRFTTSIVSTPGRNIWRNATVNSTDLKACVTAADICIANFTPQ